MQCPKCQFPAKGFGRFWRKSDGVWVRRYCCGLCKKVFSDSTLVPFKRKRSNKSRRHSVRLRGLGINRPEIQKRVRLKVRNVDSQSKIRTPWGDSDDELL